MKVFATTAISPREVKTYLPVFTRLAEQDRFDLHQLVTDPAEADVILFLDGHQHYRDINLTEIRQHPLVRQDRDRAFVYNELDQPWCAMPGLYVGMPKRSFDWQRQRPCSYLVLINDLATAPTDASVEPDLLFSYMGRLGHPVREAIMRLPAQRALIEDTSSFSFFGATTEEVARQKQRYAQTLRRSKFVLCPVGSGPSSFRLFETLAAGRVPVIVSDEWMAPAGPVWEECSLSIPERKVCDIPAIVASHESRFPEMARAARKAWEDWFAPDVLFHRMIESCRDIMESRSVSEKVMPRRVDLRYLRLRARVLKQELKTAVGRVGRKLKPSAGPA